MLPKVAKSSPNIKNSKAPRPRVPMIVASAPALLQLIHAKMPPILLLKTKSSPQDGYEEFFTENNYTPTFVPVLEHRFHAQNLSKVRDLFNSGAFGPNAQNGDTSSNPNNKYGGLIFTSQRAVEGFAQMIEEGGSYLYPYRPLHLHPQQSSPIHTTHSKAPVQTD
jgi:hypothetical protein